MSELKINAEVISYYSLIECCICRKKFIPLDACVNFDIHTSGSYGSNNIVSGYVHQSCIPKLKVSQEEVTCRICGKQDKDLLMFPVSIVSTSDSCIHRECLAKEIKIDHLKITKNISVFCLLRGRGEYTMLHKLYSPHLISAIESQPVVMLMEEIYSCSSISRGRSFTIKDNRLYLPLREEKLFIALQYQSSVEEVIASALYVSISEKQYKYLKQFKYSKVDSSKRIILQGIKDVCLRVDKQQLLSTISESVLARAMLFEKSRENAAHILRTLGGINA